MTKLPKIARIALGALGALVLAAGAVLLFASVRANALLNRRIDSHSIDIPIPNRLTDEELAALRAERGAASVDDGADPLAGLDL
ncbi:MAG: hypothetical protein H5U40_18495, partial [Polyangiaceae bacterium]|nr:hypothetical protein [Polyangiaceae bacterium]